MKPELEQQLRERKAMFTNGQPWDEVRAASLQNALPVPEDISIAKVEAGGVPALWITPPNAGSAVILYFHGGGYVLGSPIGNAAMVARIARAAGARVLSLDYRLAPEHPFPAAVDDAVAAYRWLLGQGVAPAQIVVAGDSAGGGLTIAALVALREAALPLPAAAVGISAWTDLALSGESITSRAEIDPLVDDQLLRTMSDAYLAGADPRHPLASPLYADLQGLPPLLLQVGTHEVLHDDTLRLGDKARAAGVDVTVESYEGMPHVFHGHAAIEPDAARAIERIGEFVRERTAVAV